MRGFAHYLNFLRFLPALTVVMLLCTVASAYTIVMRGGRHIEIPQAFTVTRTTLTYEAAVGVNVTLEMAAIDIAATERANNETPGSLLRRAEATVAASQEATDQRKSAAKEKRRTITNKDLESYAQARKESEAAYERRRIELGLPSLEESRRRAAAESELFEQELSERRAQQEQTENYWRSRAEELESDIQATDAQITFIRARLAELPENGSFGSPVIGNTGFLGVGHSRFNPALNAAFVPRRGVFVAPRIRAPISSRFGAGGTLARGGAFTNPITLRPGLRGFGRSRFVAGGGAIFGSPYSAYDLTGDAPALAAELDQLLLSRAGLEARLRELEDEARRAGVPPGWLRP